MNATFKLDGCYELEIAGDGVLVSRDGSGASSGSSGIGIQLHYTPLSLNPQTSTVAAIHLKRGQARAIASALLSAATESRG